MKKILALALSAMLLITCAACGAEEEPAPAKAAPEKAAPAAATAEAPAAAAAPEQAQAADPEITLKLGYSTNEEDPRGQASVQFKNEVETATNGSVKVEIYPAGQLGGDAAMIEALTLDSGTIDIVISDCSNFATYEPTMGISALPFLFKGFDDAWAFLDSDVLAGVEEKMLDYNTRVLGHFCNGFRCVTTSKVEVNSPADMAGMLIRTPENPVIMATMRALGANPQPLAFSELYMALQQGTYDAQENPVPVIYNNKLYEVQSNLSLTNHIYSGMCFAISESAWQKMTPAQQEAIKAATKTAETFDREMNRKMTEDFLAKLEEAGMKVVSPDLAPFVEATKSATAEVTANYGEELLKQLADWQAANQ